MAERETTDFLGALFGDKPNRAAVQIWIRSDKPITWFVDDLEQAAKLAIEGAEKFDVYVGCGIAAHDRERPQRQRLKADEVAGIPGVWADIDINGGPESKDGAAPDYERAMELASSLLEPTLIVKSGYGLQAWWLFEEPWIFANVAEREQAKRVVGGFQGALRAAARRLGWGLDATQDLARVMRIPGTLNHKGAEPVEVTLLQADGKRYQLEEIAELGQGFSSSQSVTSAEDTVIEVHLNGKLQLDPRVMMLRDDEQDFTNLWQMKSAALKGLRDPSLSGVEFEIARWLCRAGLTDQSIADAIVFWRNKQEPGDPRKKLRRERIAQTIARARSSVQHEIGESMAEQEREAAIEYISQVTTGATEPNEAKTVASFNKIIGGGPEIARLKQFTRDPTHARFNIELADGREVPIGTFDALASQTQFRRIYAIVTGHYPKVTKPEKWDTAVHGLLQAAYIIDSIEDSGVGQMELWIDEYHDACASPDRDGACATHSPFSEDGVRYITLSHFVKWLRRSMGERVDASDIAAQLRAMGYERRPVNYLSADGGRSTRSYFASGPARPVGRPRDLG